MHVRLHCRQPLSTSVGKATLLFRDWMRGRLIFTGRTQNANKCARILPLFQGFVEANLEFFVDNFSYVPKGKPGQRGPMFALFRDEILPNSLRFEHVRSDIEGTLSTMQDQARHVKRVSCRSQGALSARCIEGWERIAV